MLSSKQKNKLLNIVASPFFLAIPITLIILFFLPNPSSKYKIDLNSQRVLNKANSSILFCDLDGDGNDEQVVEYHNLVNSEAAIKVLTNDYINYEAWNFYGKFGSLGSDVCCGDVNNDGYKEILLIYYRDDSVFLAAIQPYPSKKVLFGDKFVTTICKRNGNIDYVIRNIQIADINNDGSKELVFSVLAGYSKQPRSIFAYDFINDSIIKSNSYGAKIARIEIVNIASDSLPKIFCGSGTSGNISDSVGIPYGDYSSWFFGFNNKFELLYPPVENPNYPSSIDICAFESDMGDSYIVTSLTDVKKRQQTIYFMDLSIGDTSFEKPTGNIHMLQSNESSILKPVIINDKSYVLSGIKNGDFILVNEKLEVVKKETHLNILALQLIADLNKDGLNEFLFIKPNLDIVIYDNNLENPTSYKVDQLSGTIKWGMVGVKHNNKKQDELYLSDGNKLYFFSYSFNYFYYLKYPMRVLTYLFVVLILWFSQKLQQAQAKRKQQIEETINSLQMKTIKSQMDPHFMFNVLNGVANNVIAGNSKDAYEQIIKFSVLLRSMMKRVDKIDISLRQEIEFVDSYLQLEKFRFKSDFSFEINISDTVNINIMIPRMLIQLLVENSIKHGLSSKEGLKNVSVSIANDNKKTIITVEDNGIGRSASTKKTKGTGRGLVLINDMIVLNKKINGTDILLYYTDLFSEDGNPSGTIVKVEIV